MDDSYFQQGDAVEIELGSFTPRLRFLADSRLELRIVAGENRGFREEVSFEEVRLGDDVVALSWQERNGTTVVHAIDLAEGVSHCLVTPANGGFLRLDGPLVTVAELALH